MQYWNIDFFIDVATCLTESLSNLHFRQAAGIILQVLQFDVISVFEFFIIGCKTFGFRKIGAQWPYTQSFADGKVLRLGLLRGYEIVFPTFSENKQTTNKIRFSGFRLIFFW